MDPLEILSGLWRRVSSMGVTSSRLEKALADYPGAFAVLFVQVQAMPASYGFQSPVIDACIPK